MYFLQHENAGMSMATVYRSIGMEPTLPHQQVDSNCLKKRLKCPDLESIYTLATNSILVAESVETSAKDYVREVNTIIL
jgi:hypothetical protein